MSLGLYKDAKTIEDCMEKVREKRKLYAEFKKSMQEAMDSYEDPLLLNPLLKVKEEVSPLFTPRPLRRRPKAL